MRILKRMTALLLAGAMLITAPSVTGMAQETDNKTDRAQALLDAIRKETGSKVSADAVFITDDPIELDNGQSIDIGKVSGKYTRKNLKKNRASVSLSPFIRKTGSGTLPVAVSGRQISANAPVRTAVKITYTYPKKKTKTITKRKNGKKVKVKKTTYTKKKYKQIRILEVISCPDDDPSYEYADDKTGDSAYSQAGYVSLTKKTDRYDGQSGKKTDDTQNDKNDEQTDDSLGTDDIKTAQGEDEIPDSDSCVEGESNTVTVSKDGTKVNVCGYIISNEYRYHPYYFGNPGEEGYENSMKNLKEHPEEFKKWEEKYKHYWRYPTFDELKEYKREAGDGTELQRFLNVGRKFCYETYYSFVSCDSNGNGPLFEEEQKLNNTSFGDRVKYIGVCGDFAVLAYIILNYVGIKTKICVHSHHAWNEVYIDGQWYSCDFTWGGGYFEPSFGTFGDKKGRSHVGCGETVYTPYGSYTTPTESEVASLLGSSTMYVYDLWLETKNGCTNLYPDIIPSTELRGLEHHVSDISVVSDIADRPTGEVDKFLSDYYYLQNYCYIKEAELKSIVTDKDKNLAYNADNIRQLEEQGYSKQYIDFIRSLLKQKYSWEDAKAEADAMWDDYKTREEENKKREEEIEREKEEQKKQEEEKRNKDYSAETDELRSQGYTDYFIQTVLDMVRNTSYTWEESIDVVTQLFEKDGNPIKNDKSSDTSASSDDARSGSSTTGNGSGKKKIGMSPEDCEPGKWFTVTPAP